MASLRRAGRITDPRIARAFQDVDRHHFLPNVPLEEVHEDRTFVTQKDADGMIVSSSTAPSLMR